MTATEARQIHDTLLNDGYGVQIKLNAQQEITLITVTENRPADRPIRVVDAATILKTLERIDARLKEKGL